MTQPRPPLGGRYSLERPLLSSRDEHHWMAIESSSGRLVVVTVVEPGRLSTLAPARGVTHRHLASLVDVVKDVPASAFPDNVKLPAGAGVAVAEHVPGRSLRAVLDDGPLHAAKAVAWILRLADAVQALHAASAVHGAISPRSVLAAAEGRAIAPVLTQLVAPAIGAFCPPERLRGGAESVADDVWALYAVLYAALTGKAPFSAPTRDGLVRSMSTRPATLASFGVDEPALQEIIFRGLEAERRGRATELSDLVSALDGWERDPKMLPPAAPPPRPAPRGLGNIVSGAAFGAGREDGVVIDDAALPDDQGRPMDSPDDDAATVIMRLPAPTPAARPAMGSSHGSSPSITPPGPGPAQHAPVPAVPKRPSFNPFARRSNVLPWILVAAVAGGGIVYLALAPSKKPDAKPPTSLTQDLPAPPRPVAPPTVKRDPAVLRDECIKAHFPQDSFAPDAALAFVCEDGDFRETAARLNGMWTSHDDADAGDDAAAPDAGLPPDVVRAVGGQDLDGSAMRLGWYELPATAIIRKTCCSGATPVVLPQTPGWCEQLQSVVRRMADDSAKSMDLAPGGRSFDKAVGCLYAERVRHGYGYDRPPTPGNRALFQQFLGRAAIISTRH